MSRRWLSLSLMGSAPVIQPLHALSGIRVTSRYAFYDITYGYMGEFF